MTWAYNRRQFPDDMTHPSKVFNWKLFSSLNVLYASDEVKSKYGRMFEMQSPNITSSFNMKHYATRRQQSLKSYF